MLQDVCLVIKQINGDADSPSSMYVASFVENEKLFQLWNFTADGT